MKMRFKIGDVVFVKTRAEICNIMDSNDCIGDCHFANDMFNHCGSTLTIDQIDDIHGVYRMKEDPWHLYNEDMISHLYEDKDNPRFAVGDKVILDPWPCEVINVRYIKEKSRFLYTVKGIDFSKLVSADMLEIDASEYPKYNVGDVVGVYGYETDVVIADVRKEGSSFAYKVYLADEEEWIYDSDIAYRGDVAKAVSSMKSNTPEVKREPLFKPEFKIGNKITNGKTQLTILTITSDKYIVEDNFGECGTLYFNTQDDWKLVESIEDRMKELRKMCTISLTDSNYTDKVEVLLNNYEYTEEGGKAYFIKKKKEYPKTYEECCKVLGYSGNYNMILTTDVDNKLFNALYRLKVCRDAYWKIYGEEMGLGKPWNPNWQDDDEKKYTMEYYDGEIIKDISLLENRILVFPTAEMRDAFYEHYKEEIEKCKELL